MNDEGVSNIIGAILVVGIIAVTLITVRVEYVPIWEETAEDAHASALVKELNAINADSHRLQGMQLGANSVDPLTLQRESGSTFTRGTRIPAVLEALESPAGAQLSADKIRISEEDGTNLIAAGGTWQAVGGGGGGFGSSEEVSDEVTGVEFFRVNFRAADFGTSNDHSNSDVLIVSIQDPSNPSPPIGEIGFRMEATSGNQDLIHIRVMTGPLNWNDPPAGQPFPDSVVYDSYDSFANNHGPGGWYYNLLEPRFSFDTVIQGAEPPFKIVLSQTDPTTMQGRYQIAYSSISDGAGTGGGSGGSGGGGLVFVSSNGVEYADYALATSGGGFLLKTNNQYLNDQTLVLENGALLVIQPEGAAFKSAPAFGVSRMTSGGSTSGVQVSISNPVLTGTGLSTSDQSLAVVLTKTGGGKSIQAASDAVAFTVTTNYPDPYVAYYRNAFLDAGFTDGAEFSVTKALDQKSVTVTINGPSSDVNTFDVFLSYTSAIINVQVN